MARKKLPVWKVIVDNWGGADIKWVNIFERPSMERTVDWLKKMMRKRRRAKQPFNREFIDEMTEELRRELLYNYWSKCEYEIVVNGWPTRYDVNRAIEQATKFATDSASWHTDKDKMLAVLDRGSVGTKIDVYDQIMSNFEHFTRIVFEYIGLTEE